MKLTRTTILVKFFILCFYSHSQNIVIDSCGLDNDALLNNYEIDYFIAGIDSSELNYGFLFNQKKILFLHGNYGATTISKSDFFNQSGKPWHEKGDFPSVQLIILSEDEKAELKNYDAILVSWSKVPVSKRNRKKFIKSGKKYCE